MPKIQPPVPIFDNLSYLSNPFKVNHFSAIACTEKAATIPGSDIDYEYAWKYLWSYTGSSATFNAYRREIERLIQWTWLVNESSVISLKRENIEDFVKFCMKPPASWISKKSVARFKTKNEYRIINPDWRPFVASVSKIDTQLGVPVNKANYRPSQASLQSMFSILSSFFNFLIQEEVISSNPVSLIRQKSKYLKAQQHEAPVRRISNLQWEYVLETIEKLAIDNPKTYERSLFVMNCLYAMYLRISELVWDER